MGLILWKMEKEKTDVIIVEQYLAFDSYVEYFLKEALKE